jgi:hypothetical protein
MEAGPLLVHGYVSPERPVAERVRLDQHESKSGSAECTSHGGRFRFLSADRGFQNAPGNSIRSMRGPLVDVPRTVASLPPCL